jgi:hypothetical protein
MISASCALKFKRKLLHLKSKKQSSISSFSISIARANYSIARANSLTSNCARYAQPERQAPALHRLE